MTAILYALALICPSSDAVFIDDKGRCVSVCIESNTGPCKIDGKFITPCFDDDGSSLCDAEFIEVDDEQ